MQLHQLLSTYAKIIAEDSFSADNLRVWERDQSDQTKEQLDIYWYIIFITLNFGINTWL